MMAVLPNPAEGIDLCLPGKQQKQLPVSAHGLFITIPCHYGKGLCECVGIEWIGLIVAEADVKLSGFTVKQTRSTHKSDRAVSSVGVVASRWGEVMHRLLLDLQAV